MVFWNASKARENERKHGVWFSDVELVFYDPFAVTTEDAASAGERRFVTVGKDGFERILVVVYTYRGHDIRVISARTANHREVKTYEEGL
ncbi:MAG: BrnT family toxin [Gammaproteobacteria bacterium]|nr:BrnT family toxin [Gammaproteobacteria bacterium]